MSIANGFLQELEQEAQTTRRLLERVPDTRLSWRPHEKGRTLGDLAMHVANVPGSVAEIVSKPSPMQAPNFADPPAPMRFRVVPLARVSGRALLARASSVSTQPAIRWDGCWRGWRSGWRGCWGRGRAKRRCCRRRWR